MSSKGDTQENSRVENWIFLYTYLLQNFLQRKWVVIAPLNSPLCLLTITPTPLKNLSSFEAHVILPPTLFPSLFFQSSTQHSLQHSQQGLDHLLIGFSLCNLGLQLVSQKITTIHKGDSANGLILPAILSPSKFTSASPLLLKLIITFNLDIPPSERSPFWIFLSPNTSRISNTSTSHSLFNLSVPI